MATEGKRFMCQWKGCTKIVIIAVKGSQIRKGVHCYCEDCNTKMTGIIRILEQTGKTKDQQMKDIFGQFGMGDLFGKK